VREIETAKIRCVEETATRLRRRFERFDERTRVHGFQVLVHRARGAPAGCQRWPMFQRTGDDDGLFCGDNRLERCYRTDALNRNPRQRFQVLRTYARFVGAHTVCK
jgi:hypothetical protein